MNKMFALIMGIFVATTQMATAQKFGYCNSGDLLTALPEVKQADSDLQAFQTQLTKKGQEMVKDFQERAGELERKKEQGTIAPKDYEAQAAKLQEERGELSRYEQEVYAKLAKKREELYKPILDRVNKAMQDVAKEGGFMFVFDAGSQILLYADETQDVTKLVKTKLGVAN
jgi:outer membrane protein